MWKYEKKSGASLICCAKLIKGKSPPLLQYLAEKITHKLLVQIISIAQRKEKPPTGNSM